MRVAASLRLRLLAALASSFVASCALAVSCSVDQLQLQLSGGLAYSAAAPGGATTIGTFSISCNVNDSSVPAGGMVAVSVGLSNGLGGFANTRAMRLGASVLFYDIYVPTTNARWTTANTATVIVKNLNFAGASSNTAVDVPIRIPEGQWNVVPGQAYVDTLQVTLTY